MNLCLGTVQFGMDYGMNGRRKPSADEAVAMLNFAVTHGIDAIDMSALYGEAEAVVGRFLVQAPVARKDLFLVSKFGTKEFDGLSESECVRKLQDVAGESLSRIGIDYLDAYICHVPSAVHDERIVQAMDWLRKSGMARSVGFSVYETEDADVAIRTGVVDFLQLPVSVLDQRMVNSGILNLAASRNVRLHARSAYVQGLALKNSEEVPQHLSAIRPLIASLERLCFDSGVSRQALALAFVRNFSQISHVVFGVHDIGQLESTISAFGADVPIDVVEAAQRIFADVDSSLVMPNKWRR